MNDDKYTRITLRIPKELHERLSFFADETSKSMNAEIIARLEASFTAPAEITQTQAVAERIEKSADEIHATLERIATLLAQK